MSSAPGLPMCPRFPRVTRSFLLPWVAVMMLSSIGKIESSMPLMTSAPARRRAAGRAVERAVRGDGHVLPGHHRAAGPGDLSRQIWPGRDHPRAAGGQVHLEIVRTGQAPYPGGGLDQLVFYLPDPAAREQMQARLAAAGARPVPQIGYWHANGGVTYQDPDGREVVFASWIYLPPGS